MLSHTQGLMLDFLMEATVVLANGKAVTASKTKNSELFWALRGAGASFGIVTDLKFRTIAAPSENYLFYYIYYWTQDEAAAAFSTIQEYSSSGTAPKEMNMRIVVGALGGSLIWLVEGVYYGSESKFQQAAEPWLSKLGSYNVTVNATEGWLDNLLYVNNNDLVPGFGTGEALEKPLDYDEHGNFFGKSLMTPKLTPAAVDGFIDYFYNEGLNSPRLWFAIIALHGGPTSAVSQVPADETSYAQRGSLLTWEFMDFWTNETYVPEGYQFLDNMLDTITKPMANATIGEYYGYADPSLTPEEVHHGYWLNHYERLTKIKKAVDPNGVFSNPQSVRRGYGY